MFNYHRYSISSRNPFLICKIAISAAWVFGLICGVFFALHTSDITVSLMRSVLYDRLSIVGLLVALVFPFVLSAILLRYLSTLAIVPLVFLKAYLFSWCACGVYFAFGDAGWLVRWFLIFSDSLIVVLLLWYWLSHASGRRDAMKSELFLCITTALLVGCFDYCVISPISSMLFSH